MVTTSWTIDATVDLPMAYSVASSETLLAWAVQYNGNPRCGKWSLQLGSGFLKILAIVWQRYQIVSFDILKSYR